MADPVADLLASLNPQKPVVSSGFFQGKIDKSFSQFQNDPVRRGLLLMLDQLQRSRLPATESAEFGVRQSSLVDALGALERSDTRQLGRTGLRGGELALALAANRTQALTRGIRSALEASIGTSLTREQSALGGITSLLGLDVQRDEAAKDRDAARLNALLGVLGQAGSAVGSVLLKPGS